MKPIAFERVFLSLTSVPVSNCKTHNLFYNIQKMNCLLPSIWSFTQAFFFVPVAAESFTEWRVGSVETRVETEYLFTNIDPKKNWTNIVPRAGILNFRYSTAMCKYELQLRFGALWCEWTLLYEPNVPSLQYIFAYSPFLTWSRCCKETDKNKIVFVRLHSLHSFQGFCCLTLSSDMNYGKGEFFLW